MSRPIRPAYKTRNWPAYNEALKRRGSLTIWFDPAMTWEATPTRKRGRQPDYSDAAIQTCLTMKVLFGMALRQTTGFVESLLRLSGLDWVVPNFSTLSRRQKTLQVNMACFREIEDGLARANGLPFGLASYIFTNSLERADRAATGLQAGMVSINHFGLALPETPFGGVRDSGYGSEGGTETFDGYLSTKFISRNSAPVR